MIKQQKNKKNKIFNNNSKPEIEPEQKSINCPSIIIINCKQAPWENMYQIYFIQEMKTEVSRKLPHGKKIAFKNLKFVQISVSYSTLKVLGENDTSNLLVFSLSLTFKSDSIHQRNIAFQ